MFAGLGLSLTGLFEGYLSIMALGVVSGIGIAAYHPEAARLVNFAAENRKSSAMSIFGVRGTIGFTVGPILISTAMLQWGLGGTLSLFNCDTKEECLSYLLESAIKGNLQLSVYFSKPAKARKGEFVTSEEGAVVAFVLSVNVRSKA